MPSTDPNRGEAIELPSDTELTGFDRLYGLQILELGDGEIRAKVELTGDHMQPAGIAHGGIYASMAESMCSIATWMAVGGGKVVSGMNNNTSFLRPIASGGAHAHGRARHRGRTTWVWEVDVTDDEGRLAAISRVTIAIRDL